MPPPKTLSHWFKIGLFLAIAIVVFGLVIWAVEQPTKWSRESEKRCDGVLSKIEGLGGVVPRIAAFAT